MLGTGSIATKRVGSAAAECCAACVADPRCAAAFTFDAPLNYSGARGNKSCFLKGNAEPAGRCNPHPGQTACCSGGVPGRKPSPAPPSPHPPPHKPALSGYNTACKDPATRQLKFCDASLPRAERLLDLVARINASEMGSQLTARESSALPRLGIPAYYFGTNALHAFREAPCVKGADGATHCPTSFPTPPNYGAAFNRSLSMAMGRSFGTELRAMYNVGAVHSLDTWSPTINLARDPRWGRTDETPSEDPCVLGQHALHNVLGAQNGPDPTVPMIGVTLKHWIANNVEGGVGHFSRQSIDCNISAYDLASSYMPGYETAIKQGNALGIMCSYNAVNGKPTCANSELLQVLRGDWKFEGYITSDSDSCECIFNPHKMAPDLQHAAQMCLAGGTNINSGGTYRKRSRKGSPTAWSTMQPQGRR